MRRDPDLFITKFVFYLDEVGADSGSLNAIPGNLFPAYGQAMLGYVPDPGDSPGRRKQVRALLQPYPDHLIDGGRLVGRWRNWELPEPLRQR